MNKSFQQMYDEAKSSNIPLSDMIKTVELNVKIATDQGDKRTITIATNFLEWLRRKEIDEISHN